MPARLFLVSAPLDSYRIKCSKLIVPTMKTLCFLTACVLAALSNVVTRQSLGRRRFLAEAIDDVAVFTAVGGVLGCLSHKQHFLDVFVET